MEQIKLITQLEELPLKLYHLGQETEDLRQEWKRQQLWCDALESKKSLLFKAHDNNKTVTEIKWSVLSDNEVYKTHIQAVRKEADYRKKEKEYDAMQEKINSLKVIARLQQVGG